MAAEKAIKEQCNKQGIKRDADVEELYLPKCKIKEVPDLGHFKNLKRLWLNENQLYRLGGLKRNFHITELYLQNNMLTDINDTIQQLTCMQVLLLQGNQLTNLTDVMHEVRYMQNLKVLNLFGNPLAQDYDYRLYVIFSVNSLEILDRKAISRDERQKCMKKYAIEKHRVENSVAFWRRADVGGTCNQQETAESSSCLRPDPSYGLKHMQYEIESSSGIPRSEESHEDLKSDNDNTGNERTRNKPPLMQLNRFGWIDVLEARAQSKDAQITPCIYTTKFR